VAAGGPEGLLTSQSKNDKKGRKKIRSRGATGLRREREIL
jgi:hypothetical protein